MNPLKWSRKAWIGWLAFSAFMAVVPVMIVAMAGIPGIIATVMIAGIGGIAGVAAAVALFVGAALAYWIGAALSREWSQEQRIVWLVLTVIGGFLGWALFSPDTSAPAVGYTVSWFFFGAGIAAGLYYAWRLSHPNPK